MDDLFFVNNADGSDSGLPAVFDDRISVDHKKILQPKTVTRAIYRISRLHYQMLVHIREELQLYITNNPQEISSQELITVPLFCKHYPHFAGKASAFFDSVKEFMSRKNVVSFQWCYNSSFHKSLFQWMQRGRKGRSATLLEPADGELIQEASVIIVNAVRCVNDPDKIIVSINPQVLPFLLYYGPGVGGTCFDRDVLLRMGSWFSCRLYEYIMDWSTSCSVKVISLKELRHMLQYPESYKVYDVKRKVLDVAKLEFEQTGSSVLFDYKFEYQADFGPVTGTRGRYPSNCVVFTLYKKEFSDWKELSRKQLQVMLQGIADREKMHFCEALAKQIVENGQDGKVKSKFAFYDKKVHSGKMSVDEYRNTMLKIVREVSGFDLRSDAHIRNSIRTRKKTKRIDNEPRLLFD